MVDRYPLVGIEYGIIVVVGRLFGPDGAQKITLILDTGASTTTLRASALTEVGIDLSASKERRQVDTMAGPVVEGVIEVPRLRIFGQERAPLEVIFTDRPFPYRVDGVLGINFLLPYRLCIDFPAGWIELSRP
jgi:hypothetical protein